MEIWTGTADVTNGDATITVNTGDALSDANCSAGSLVLIDGVAYFVLSRTSTLEFELTRAYAGTTDTAVAMEISPVAEATTNLVNLATIVARVQSQLNIFDKNSQGLFFNLLGVTGSADPGPGNMALNNADPTAITQVYFDYLDANDAHYSVAGLLATIGQNTRLRIRSLTSAAYIELRVTSALSDQTGYYAGEVAYVDHDGVIGDSEPVSVNWSVDGQSLDVDASGTFAGRDTYDDEAGGFRYLSNDGDGADLDGGVLFIKDSATTGDWGPGIPLRGEQGSRGWSPRLAVASDGDRRVLQLAGYVGGDGVEPTIGVGQYISVGGLDPDIADGVDLRGPQGDAGSDGTDGEDGADGVDGTDPGVLLNFDDSTTDADPGAGNFRADNADLSAATFLYVSKTNRAGDDISAFLAGLADSTNPVKGSLTLTRTGGNAQAIFDLSGITDATDYVKIAVTSHSGSEGFLDADAVSLQFVRYGDQGSADGISVASAINGSPEVTAPAAATKFAITDPDSGDVLSWLTLDTLSDFISPPAATVDAKSSNYTVLASDAGKLLTVSAAAAPRTITLPAAATVGNGFSIKVKKSDSSVNTVAIDANAAETIDGSLTKILRKEDQSISLVCDGANWQVFGSDGAADTSGIEANIAAVALEIADLKGARLNMADGIADAFGSEDDVDTATSTGESYDAANDLYSPSVTTTTVNVGTAGGTSAQSGVTLVDLVHQLTAGDVIAALGVNLGTGQTVVPKIVKRNSAGNFDIVVSETLVHGGTGLEYVALSSNFTVPGTGAYYLAAYVNGTIAVRSGAAISRAFKVGNITGSAQAGFTEDSNVNVPVMAYKKNPSAPSNMTLVSNAFTASAQPGTARIALFVDPREAMTINTDLTAEVSRDGGTTWTAATLVLVSNVVSTVEQYESSEIDISAQPAGTSMKYRVKTLNNKDINAAGVVFRWS